MTSICIERSYIVSLTTFDVMRSAFKDTEMKIVISSTDYEEYKNILNKLGSDVIAISPGSDTENTFNPFSLDSVEIDAAEQVEQKLSILQSLANTILNITLTEKENKQLQECLLRYYEKGLSPTFLDLIRDFKADSEKNIRLIELLEKIM